MLVLPPAVSLMAEMTGGFFLLVGNPTVGRWTTVDDRQPAREARDISGGVSNENRSEHFSVTSFIESAGEKGSFALWTSPRVDFCLSRLVETPFLKVFYWRAMAS